jgi:hypothetical protein
MPMSGGPSVTALKMVMTMKLDELKQKLKVVKASRAEYWHFDEDEIEDLLNNVDTVVKEIENARIIWLRNNNPPDSFSAMYSNMFYRWIEKLKGE